ncbi:membrane protein [Lentibacillus kapialis]|uniref:Membrane protein n=1 Tax=Lentibacillus kapialis TaxID=340214 RepID=A0A917PU01_9BACI|nr:threonine/serine exporter family protein [Lentibacillus kapialis]GGJ91536.1 membrane protein [Lentibacillus kapialis]
MITAQLITSFIAAAGFGVLFNAPKRALIQCGIVGMSGWILFYSLSTAGMDIVPATVFGAILAGILSQICARMFKMPVIIISVSGIIPLVPGGVAYDAMRHFVENDYYTAVQLSAKVMLLAGAIAIGLMFSEVANQIMRKMNPKNAAS